ARAVVRRGGWHSGSARGRYAVYALPDRPWQDKISTIGRSSVRVLSFSTNDRANYGGRYPMDLYVIRRPSGWRTPEQLQAAAARSKQVGDEEMSTDIRWIRSYVVHEADGGLGTVCIYQASSPEKIREHASRAGLPATEIVEVADTVLVRPDPVAVAA